jgi:hypothetical protein
MVVSFFRFWLAFIWVVVVVLFVVEDFIGGERVGEVVKISSSDNDLFTAWILRLFQALFTYVGVGGSVSFSASDDTGTARTFVLKGIYGADSFVFNTNTCVQGVRVRYGMSSTPASRTDNRLLQEIYVDGNPRVVMDETRGFVMVESVVSFGADTIICEVGLSMAMTVSGTSTCGEVLLDRTVYDTCRSIPANTPYTVRYRVQL